VRVALIGGTGCGGRAAAAALLAAGHDVLCVHREAGDLPPAGAVDAVCDRRDTARLAGVLASLSPEAVVDHAADGPSDVDLLLSAVPEETRRYVLVGSAGVYGLARDRPYAEDDPPRPASDYMRARWAAEARAFPWAGCCRRVVRLRLGALYGPGHAPLTPLGRAPDLLDRLGRGEVVPVPADPAVRLQPWAARDHGRLVVALLEDPDPPEVLNVAGAELLSWEQVLAAWAAAVGAPPPRPEPLPAGELAARAPARLRPFLRELHRPPALDTTLLAARYPALWPPTPFSTGVRDALDA